MDTDLFVENSFALTAKMVMTTIRDVLDIGPVMYKKPHPDVDYWFDDIYEPSILMVSVRGGEPQQIGMELKVITYGERAYFQCECGVRVSKLFLPPHATQFKCRKCHALRYQLSTINRNSVAGKKLYQATRVERIINKRTHIDRIFYRGEYTKRFESFLTQCDKAGLDTVLYGAAMMKVLLQGNYSDEPSILHSSESRG